MEHIAVALETLNNFNPLVLVIVLFGLIIILIIAALYAFIRWGLPAISTFVTEWSDSFQAASASWRELVVEQKLNNEQQRTYYERRASNLEERVETLEKESKAKDARIKELEKQIAAMEAQLQEKDALIKTLEKQILELQVSNVAKEELSNVLQAERDEVKKELEQVMAERDQIQEELNKVKGRLDALEAKEKNTDDKKT